MEARQTWTCGSTGCLFRLPMAAHMSTPIEPCPFESCAQRMGGQVHRNVEQARAKLRCPICVWLRPAPPPTSWNTSAMPQRTRAHGGQPPPTPTRVLIGDSDDSTSLRALAPDEPSFLTSLPRRYRFTSPRKRAAGKEKPAASRVDSKTSATTYLPSSGSIYQSNPGSEKLSGIALP